MKNIPHRLPAPLALLPLLAVLPLLAGGLPTTADLTIATTGNFFFVPAGDVNGDGYADLLAARPNQTTGGKSQAGEAYFLPGGPGGLPTTLPAALIVGAVAGDKMGTTIAAAGDVNGDGFD